MNDDLNVLLRAFENAAELLGALKVDKKLECSEETRLAIGLSDVFMCFPVDVVDMEYGYVRVTARCEMSDTTIIRKIRLI